MPGSSKGSSKRQSHKRFLFGGPERFFDPLSSLKDDAGIISGPFVAFQENLKSAFQVGCIPFQIVQSAVIQQRFNQIHTAARIRAMADDVDGIEAEKRSFSKARKEMDKEIKQKDSIKYFAESVIYTLESHLNDADFSNSADELLRQVIVMAWGAFETLITDSVRLVLNHSPDMSLNLLAEKGYADIMMGKRLAGELERRGFDLSGSMGDILVENVRIDSLDRIHDICSRLFEDPNLNRSLKNNALWTLSQQRHLIVHRRGIVDSRYLSKTSDRRRAGEALKLSADEVEGALILVRDTGIIFTKVAAG